MESLINRLFLYQWQRKCLALLTATIIWFFVNHSITATKTVPSVPIRIVNLPVDKTIQGLLPNGFLSKRTTLTVSGTKDVIENLEPGDIEVLLDVSNQPNEGVVQISKKNLTSLNPDINLGNHITSVSHPEFVLKLSSVLTDQIPVTIQRPIGNAPAGYEYLDSYPILLMQTVSGPQEQVLDLKAKGLQVTFNLNDISKEQLDALQNGLYDDEISFYVPEQWKKIVIPYLSQIPEPLNDPDAKNLRINFLRQSLIPIKTDLPIHVFYPLRSSLLLNPETYSLLEDSFVQIKNNIPILKIPLFAQRVSKLFVEVVKDNLEMQIVAAPKSEREKLEWGIGFIDASHLEDTYVAFLMNHLKANNHPSQTKMQELERHFRKRFRNYMQKFALFLSANRPLEVESSLQDHHIAIHIPNAAVKPKVNSNAR